ncbi:MAG: DNA repair protein RecO [Parachlamydiaceae bacterium]|nr:DNA repair protein RecO [Parachlamydiaceae bacterium]
MEIHKSEGVVLHALKYGDYDQILTVFTREEGLIKLIVKGAYRNQKKATSTAPLTQAEFIYAKRQSTLFLCQEKSVINYHLGLRESLERLEGACALVKSLTATQVELKPAHLVYELLICYMERLSQAQAKQVQNLVSSFQLKLLRHEGLFGLTPHCKQCNEDLVNHYIVQGENFCKEHKPDQGISLTAFEAQAVFTLAFSRSLPLIEESVMDLGLKEKIDWLFESLLG